MNRPGSNLESSSEPMFHQVAEGPFDHIVLEQGEIESSSNNEVKCEVKGRGGSGTPILSVIPEGTLVKKGETLCQLDSSALDQDAKNQRIIVSSAESAVISAEAAVNKAVIARSSECYTIALSLDDERRFLGVACPGQKQNSQASNVD